MTLFANIFQNNLYIFRSEELLEKVPVKHVGKKSECPLCKKTFSGSSQMSKHLGCVHELVVEICLDNGIDLVKLFKDKPAPKVNDIDAFKCHVCNEVFPSKVMKTLHTCNSILDKKMISEDGIERKKTVRNLSEDYDENPEEQSLASLKRANAASKDNGSRYGKKTKKEDTQKIIREENDENEEDISRRKVTKVVKKVSKKFDFSSSDDDSEDDFKKHCEGCDKDFENNAYFEHLKVGTLCWKAYSQS